MVPRMILTTIPVLSSEAAAASQTVCTTSLAVTSL